jgi:hypothetical protein
VFHSAAVLCVTLMFDSARAAPAIDAAYSGLIDVLVPALTDVGVNATIGPAPGAPCDGRFNVLVDGRKLAGTAVRVRSIGARHCILAHAAIIVDDGYAECLAAIEGFESDLGLCSAYRQDACIGAREIMDPSRRGAPLESLAATLVRRSQMQSV